MIVNIANERDLHYKVVDYIRKYIKEAIIVPGLGELQSNSNLRADAYYKGYAGGQPDILLLNYHTKYRGLAIELKTPTGRGVLSKNQENYMNNLKHNGFMTLVSCDYDDIITTIIRYSLGIRYTIYKIKRKFRSVEARNKYLKN
jgi:hypothetical protein